MSGPWSQIVHDIGTALASNEDYEDELDAAAACSTEMACLASTSDRRSNEYAKAKVFCVVDDI
jgi:hypothetical protein